MRKCAVIIGVNKVGKISPLEGAADGARQFQEWASSQGYTTRLLTDEEEGAEVTLSDVTDAVASFIEEECYDVMIIYFSGHGVWKDTLAELWLLSHAARSPIEAVNVISSAISAEYCSIPHVVFISDACRTTPHSLLKQVTGSAVFPTEPIPKLADVDRFSASRVFKPAYERKAANGEKAFGVFTKVILEGLSGAEDRIISVVDTVEGKIKVIEPKNLKRYLEKEVPVTVAMMDSKCTQEPDVRIQSQSPRHLARFGEALADDSSEERDCNERLAAYLASNELPAFTKYAGKGILIEKDPTPYIDPRLMHGFDTYPAKFGILEPIVRDCLRKYRSCFIIDGANGLTVNRQIPADHVISVGNYTVITVPGNYISDYLLLRLSNGHCVPLTIVPNFTGVVLIKNNHVVNISYYPGPYNFRYEDSNRYSQQLIDIRAFVATAVQMGTFRLTGTADDLQRAAGLIRYQKALDPTLGVYAAYAYSQAGDWEQVSSVYEYMSLEKEPVIFDVAMLNSLSPQRNTFDLYRPAREEVFRSNRKAGFGPVLTQGWSYLNVYGDKCPAYLQRQAQYLVPGLWTTFTKKGGALAEKKLEERD